MRRGDPQRIEVVPIVSSDRQAVTNVDRSAFTLSHPRCCVAAYCGIIAAKTTLAADVVGVGAVNGCRRRRRVYKLYL